MTPGFTPLYGYETLYEINEEGVVKQLPRRGINSIGRKTYFKGKTMTNRIDKQSGYIVTKLTKPDGSYGSQYVHRLVALTFIPNPLNKEFVNHLNGNKLDPSRKNLEWTTRSENQLHAIMNNLAKIPGQNMVPVINICSGRLYPTMTAAAKDLHINYDHCKKLIGGRIPNTTCLRRAA